MTTSLNLYATKVFSEQPTALWALDDTVDYVALIDSNNQDISNWDIVGGTAVDALAEPTFEDPSLEPFPGTIVNGITEGAGNNRVITFTSSVTLQQEDLSQDLGSFAIGTYVFTYDANINVRLGYEYINPDTLEEVQVIRENVVNQLPAERAWAFVSETFSLPESFQDLKFIIETYPPDNPPVEYRFAIHGINIGQWAEEYHVESMGVIPQSLPANIDIDSQAVPAQAYGIEGSEAYYLARGNYLYAKNSGLPLVYGAFNSTVIFPNTNRPSLIVPGFGFMNQSGQYKNFTFEFWAKINSGSLTLKRIFGPIASEDGLYVDGPFLKLRIGENFGAHYIGEWNRPMLLDIRLTSNSAELILNGEIVISLELDPETITFPEKEDVSGNDQDWLGFYAYEDVPTIQIDCVGIYPYEVPAIVAKRRFVYGQGVEFPTNIKGLDPSTPISISYPVANYSKNYSYPLIGKWRNGVVENVLPNAAELSLPEYSLPTVKFNNKTVNEWYSDSYGAHYDVEDSFISLRPDAGWDSTEGYILFPNLNLLLDDTKCFYGIFEIEELPTERQILFDLVNEVSGDKLTIYLQNSEVYYSLSYQSVSGTRIEENFYYSSGHVTGSKFLVGLHLPRAIANYGKRLGSFFGAKQNIRVFVGGNKNFTNTFAGKISRVGFCTSRNLSKIENQFADRGIPSDFENVFDLYEEGVSYEGGAITTSFWEIELDGGDPYDFPIVRPDTHLASYTLLPKVEFDTYKLDIGVDSYWEDYLPLSYFGTYVANAENKKEFDLDFIQLNIDYPNFYNVSGGSYDTTGSVVKTYVSFQYLSEGSNKTRNAFTSIRSLPESGSVVPGNEWLFTKYEVLDDTIIYPPPGVDFNLLSINIHIEISVEGISANPLKIRSLQLASQAFGFSPKRIGNKFGAEMYPYKKVGNYFEYKLVDPFSIYKGSSPYLYTSANNGIKIKGDLTSSQETGITMPINKNKNDFFKVSSFQIALRHDKKQFPSNPVQIFEIEHKEDIVRFYIVADSPGKTRGQIFAISNNTGELYPGIVYSVDGKTAKRPVMTAGLWSVLGISFTPAIDLGNFVGAIRVTNPIIFNNVSYYQITPEDEAEGVAFRKWYAVRSAPNQPLDWQYWKDLEGDPNPENSEETLPYSWNNVLFLTEARENSIDTTNIYKQYTGTDRVIFQSDSTLQFNNYRYSAFKDVRWSRQILDSA